MKIELEKILVYYLLKCQVGLGELSLLFNKGSKGYFSLYPFIYYNNFLSFFVYCIRSLIIEKSFSFLTMQAFIIILFPSMFT